MPRRRAVPTTEVPQQPKTEIELILEKIADSSTARLKANKEIILKALKDIGAVEVRVEYSGSGDSGQIDDISVRKRSGRTTVAIPNSELPAVKVVSHSSNFVNGEWVHKAVLLETQLNDALDAFTCDWLEERGIDWYNNDGGAGNLEIDVENDKFDLNHATYYTESSSESFDL